MGIILIVFLLAQTLAINPVRAVPQVLGTHTTLPTKQIDRISKHELKIQHLEKISEINLQSSEIKFYTPPPFPVSSTAENSQDISAPKVQIGYSEQILNALNVYRQKNGVSTVQNDQKLCDFALSRAQIQDQQGGLDSHNGFNEFLANKDNFALLGVHGIGENSAWNFIVPAQTLIETIFSGDEGHQKNQLNPDWTLACAGVSGKTVDIIFGRR